jgi:diacylglycerol kinase (ATP)
MSSLRQQLASFKFAFLGIGRLLRSEVNARIHLAATILVTAAGFYCQVTTTEWCILVLAMMAVWVTEAVNTAVEWLCDRISPEYDPVIGKVKDVAAGAVLISALAALVIGILIFLPHVRTLLD